MKKYQNLFLMMFLILSTLFTTIAYAGLSQRLAITGEAEFRVPADIRVTGISIGQTNGNVYNYAPKYSKDTITMGFNLAGSSSITYNVTVRNSGDIDQTIYDVSTVSTNNQGVTCSLTGYNKKDVIGYRDSVTFGVTCTSASAAENVNIVLQFDFRKVYYVTYDANSGTNAPSAQIKYENEDLEITSDEPTKANYTFVGWSDSSSATTAQYEPGDTYTLNSDKLLYAVWQVNSYKVTYDKTTNGGTGPNEEEPCNYNESIDLTKTASKTGWTFVGWNTNKNAQTALSSLTMGEQAVTLYAIYSKTLTGTFNYYNSESTTVTATIYNTETSGTITAPGALGGDATYTFNGWSESNVANPGNNKVGATASITITENKNYYASYTYSLTGTFVYYDGSTYTSTANVATAYMNYSGSKTGAAPTVPTVSTPSTWTNRGWATGTSGDSALVTPSTIITNQTYYYTYSKSVTATVCVYNNSCSDKPTTAAYLTSYNNGTIKDASIDLGTTSLSGYTFRGWSESNTANATVLQSNTVNINTNQTYYASYSYTVTITYTANGGSTPTTSSINTTTAAYMNYTGTKVSGYVTMPAATTREGYTFEGWGTNNYEAGEVVYFNADTTLAAQWSANDYTVTFSKGNTMNNVEFVANNATVEKYDDYYLVSGSMATSGVYIPDEVFENGKSYILKYKIQKIDGTLKNIGGHLQHEEEYFKIDGILQSESYANHPSISDDTNIHTVELKFLYDSTQSSSNSKVYIQPNRALTVPVSVKIFDISLEEVYYTKQVTYGSTYGTLPQPTREGYTFDGWNGKNLFDKSAVPYKTKCSLDGDATEYCSTNEYSIYQINIKPNTTYTITNSGKSNNPGYVIYDASGTILTFDKYNVRSVVTFTTPANASYMRFSVVTLSGSYRYDKDIFQLEEGSTSTTYEPYYVTSSTTVTQAKDHTLTAKWTPINTNISKAYIYDETNNATKCINGEEETCVETKCYEHFNNNSCEQGTIIKYKVNNNEEKYFYVLHDDGNKMTLQQRENTVRNVAWHAGENNNASGPDTILPQLEAATSTWTNVNSLSYEPGVTTLYQNAYTGCTFSGGANGTYLTSCGTNKYTSSVLGTRSARARMITALEASSTGCLVWKDGAQYTNIMGNSIDAYNQGSCPDWMHNYLYDSTSYGGSYKDNSKNIEGAYDYGYRTMSAHSGTSASAWSVYHRGYLLSDGTSSTNYGARAVIEIDKQRSSNQYTVTYNGNGSTGGSTATSTHNYDESKALTTNGYTKTGYTFAGWSTSPSDKNIINDDTEYHYDNTSGSAYYDVQRYYLPGPYVAGEVYQVEYDAKGSGNLFNYFHGDSGYLRVANAVQFDGDTKIISTSYDGDNHVQLSSNYRHITARFTLSSTGDGNVRKHLLFRATAGSNLYVKNIKFYKVSSSSMAYTDGQTVKNLAVNGNVNLYAIWKPVESTITLDPKFYTSSSASSASVTPTTSGTTSITSAYNTSLSPTSISMPYTNTLSATNGTIYAITYNNIKYGFEGYYEGKACTGTQRIKADGTYTNFTSTTYTSNTTLYACWKKINAGADTSASHVNYSCGASSGCPASSINTVQKALDDLYTKFN